MRPRNEPCPKRPPGLWHHVDGSALCRECGALTYDRPEVTFRLPEVVVRLVATMPPCWLCDKPKQDRRARLCDDCAFKQRASFQHYRFKVGEMDEYAPLRPFVRSAPGEPVGIGSYDDWEAETIKALVKG